MCAKLELKLFVWAQQADQKGSATDSMQNPRCGLSRCLHVVSHSTVIALAILV